MAKKKEVTQDVGMETVKDALETVASVEETIESVEETDKEAIESVEETDKEAIESVEETDKKTDKPADKKEAKKQQKAVEIPGRAKELMRMNSRYKELYVDSKGGVYTRPHGSAVLYKNPYFKN